MSEEVVQEHIENAPQDTVEQPVKPETNEEPIVEEPINTETTETVEEVIIETTNANTEASKEPIVEVEEDAAETTQPNTEDQTFTTANDMEVEQEDKEPEREPLNEPTLHISGLPVTVKASELAPILESYGEVTKIVILPPKTIYQSYGFVSYETKEEAQRCLDSLNNTKFVFDNQYTWKVNWARQGPMKNASVGPSGRPYTFTDKPRAPYRRGGFRGGRGGFRGGRGRGGFRGGRGRGGYRPY
ncbi:hypothetical protein ACO0R3_002482 [Hanseniaspora guilliermondii]